MKRTFGFPDIVITIMWMFIVFGAIYFYTVRYKELKNYKEAYEVLKESQNTVIMKMDASCYEQFTNNMNKTLYLKMVFDE